jgi:hypothetical protein
MSPLHQVCFTAKLGFLELLSKTAMDHDSRELKHQSTQAIDVTNEQNLWHDHVPCSNLLSIELHSAEKSCAIDSERKNPQTSVQMPCTNSQALNAHLSPDLVGESATDNRKHISITCSPTVSPPDSLEQKGCHCVSRMRSPLCMTNLIRENVDLKIELGEARKKINVLLNELNRSSCNIRELRLLSEGNKISDIPVADMIEIMKEYGSEVSNKKFLQARKENPQPASIVRQFRRWNPNFFQYFDRQNGIWIPKLGKAEELQRRQRIRNVLRHHRQNPPASGSSLHKDNGRK